MRRDRSSLIRAVSGALPATCLSLLGSFFATSFALAADIPCDRSAAPELPSGRLHLSVVDLPGEPDTAAALDALDALDAIPAGELTRDLPQDARPPGPDFSSRTRSLAILREIFGEPVSDDSLDVAVAPAQELPRQSMGKSAVQDPAAEASDGKPAGVSANDGAALLPGLSGEESIRYRRQMYRTDI